MDATALIVIQGQIRNNLMLLWLLQFRSFFLDVIQDTFHSGGYAAFIGAND